MDVIVPAIPDRYDEYRRRLTACIAEHKPVSEWRQRSGIRVPDGAEDVEQLRTYVRAIHDAGFVADRFSTEQGDPYEQRIMQQEFAAAGIPHVLGNPLVAGALLHFGTRSQRATYLPPMPRATTSGHSCSANPTPGAT